VESLFGPGTGSKPEEKLSADQIFGEAKPAPQKEDEE
jgi:hypothetical protein